MLGTVFVWSRLPARIKTGGVSVGGIQIHTVILEGNLCHEVKERTPTYGVHEHHGMITDKREWYSTIARSESQSF